MPLSLNDQAVVIRADRSRALFVPALCRLYDLDDCEIPEFPGANTHAEISLEELPTLRDEIWREIHERIGNNKLHRHHSPGIALIITQNCNLSCSYCLAKQGTFGLELSTANVDLVKGQIAKLFDNYPDIDFIKFFGGEPTLRMDLIESICKFVSTELGRDVHFAVTTNGTLQAKEHLEVWRRYRVSVSVSIDGPAEIHDAERVDKKGRGSHEKASIYANTLRDSGFPFAVVGVFDDRHIRASISYLETIQYLNQISPLTKVQFLETLGSASEHDVLASNGNFVQCVTQQIEKAVAAIINLASRSWVSPDREWLYDNNIMRFVYGVMSEKAIPYEHACTAANLTTIFPGGEVMPCYTFSEDPSLHLGRVTSSTSEIEARRDAFRRSHAWEKLSGAGVRAPWYRGIVGDICVADMRNSALEGIMKQSRFYALFQEIAVSAVLREVFAVSRNPLEIARLQHAVTWHRRITGEFVRNGVAIAA